MDSASGRADYADARHVHSREQSLATRNATVDEVESSEAEGVGVRVRVGGAWGFAATREVDRVSLERALEEALAIAAAQPRAPATPLAPEPAARGRWDSPYEIDPFDVPLDDKLATLVAADEAMQGDERVGLTSAYFLAFRDDETFASTDGALCEQTK